MNLKNIIYYSNLKRGGERETATTFVCVCVFSECGLASGLSRDSSTNPKNLVLFSPSVNSPFFYWLATFFQLQLLGVLLRHSFCSVASLLYVTLI
jgi:hypothetical protein